ncbi:MAG: TetR/AcrR family transcriptional regulator [Bacteroidales bacterium]|nr:TetR/AcrR family transcriptional regulator [Bacteroidales bacterium]
MQHKDNTTEQTILEVAENLFLDKGFALTSTTEIARIVGCNQALVHYYFRSKERLFEAVFEKHLKLFIHVFLECVEQNISFEEKVRMKIETHFDLLKANPKMPFLFFNEMIANPIRLNLLKEKIGALPETFFSQIESELKKEIEKGTIRPMKATDLMLTILSLNTMLFLAGPVLEVISGMTETEYHNFFENRKRENITIILKSLRP